MELHAFFRSICSTLLSNDYLGIPTLTPFMVGFGGVCLIYILEVDLEGNLPSLKRTFKSSENPRVGR